MASAAAGTIVVVEDDQHIADLVELYLREEGFRVIQAHDGQKGLDAVRDQDPRLVILDVGLPGTIDGLEVSADTRFLRSHVLELPVHQDLTDAHLEYIARQVSLMNLRMAA